MKEKNVTSFAIPNKIHRAMCIGIILYLIVSLKIRNLEMSQADNILSQVAVGFAFLAIVAGLFYPPILAKSKTSQNEPMNYQVVKLIQWAIIEGATLFNITQYFTQGTMYSFAVSLILILFMISRYPNEKEMNQLFPANRLPPKKEDDGF